MINRQRLTISINDLTIAEPVLKLRSLLLCTLHPFFSTLRHSHTLPRYSFSRSIVHPGQRIFRTHLARDQLLHRSLERSPPSAKLAAIDARHLLAECLNQAFFECNLLRLSLRHTFLQTRGQLRLIRWRVHRSIHQRPTHSLIRHARKDIVTDFVNSCVSRSHQRINADNTIAILVHEIHTTNFLTAFSKCAIKLDLQAATISNLVG